MAHTSEALRLPDGWYWLFYHKGTRQHWFGHVDGAKVIVMEGALRPTDPPFPQVLVCRGDMVESRAAADMTVNILAAAGYHKRAHSEMLVLMDWRRAGPCPGLDACRDYPPFPFSMARGAEPICP